MRPTFLELSYIHQTSNTPQQIAEKHTITLRTILNMYPFTVVSGVSSPKESQENICYYLVVGWMGLA